MLYERWLATVRARRNELAVRDFATGQRWTFAQLAARVESPRRRAQGLVHPQGHGVDFLISVLRGWHAGGVVCPLEAGQKPPFIPKPPANCAHLKTTSATTGAPRMIMFTAEQLIADAENIVAAMGLRTDWPNLAAISLAHSYGFSNIVLTLLLQGIPLLLAPAALPDTLRRVAAGEPGLTLPAVPVLWRAWHEARAIPAGVRLALSAGAPLPLALERDIFTSTGIKVHNFYGASECGGIAYDGTIRPRQTDALVGRPLNNVALSVARSGCLVVRSPAVGLGYWPRPDPALRDGCFRTSDLVQLRRGAVLLRGRVGDQINVAGRKFSPQAVERVLAACGGVEDSLVFGVPGRLERAEQVVACVVARPTLKLERLKHFAAERLPSWQVPRDWWLVKALSGNRRGKLSRADWRRRYLETKGKKPGPG